MSARWNVVLVPSVLWLGAAVAMMFSTDTGLLRAARGLAIEAAVWALGVVALALIVSSFPRRDSPREEAR